MVGVMADVIVTVNVLVEVEVGTCFGFPSPRKVLHDTSVGRVADVVFQWGQLDEMVSEGPLVVEVVFVVNAVLEDQLSQSDVEEVVEVGFSSQGQT
jgi:hypothetical protein